MSRRGVSLSSIGRTSLVGGEGWGEEALVLFWQLGSWQEMRLNSDPRQVRAKRNSASGSAPYIEVSNSVTRSATCEPLNM